MNGLLFRSISVVAAVVALTISGAGFPAIRASSVVADVASGSWTNVTSNLANMPSECGNLTMLSPVPGSGRVIAGVALKGLWASDDGGASWSNLGTDPGSAAITNRPSWISYDPDNSAVFWESGIYNGAGAFKTTDGGKTFVQLGTVTHNDFISVDYTDPDRKTILVGGHEQSRTVWKSTDGGQSWANIGVGLPSGTGFSTDPLILDAQTYLVNSDQRFSQQPGIFRTTDGGSTWTKVSSSGPWGAPRVTPDAIYWSVADRLAKSNDQGMSWTLVGAGLLDLIQPILLPNGELVSVMPNSLVASADGGATWSPIGPPLPYRPAGVVYSAVQKAFYIWHWDCGKNVLPDAIEKVNYEVTSTSSPGDASTTDTSPPGDGGDGGGGSE